MTYKISSIEQINELLRLLHESVDAFVDLGHPDSPDLARNPPGVPMPDDQLSIKAQTAQTYLINRSSYTCPEFPRPSNFSVSSWTASKDPSPCSQTWAVNAK
jgi:hypothetical protein